MLPWQFAVFEDFEEEERRERNEQYRLENLRMRNRSDPFNIPVRRFQELFRLTKDMVAYLLNGLVPHMTRSSKRNAVVPDLRIFAALAFFATGNYQRPIGQSYFLFMSQQAVGKSIKEVSRLICTHLTATWIKFPTTLQEKQAIALKFMEKSRFPGCIGAVDCTHIDMIAPTLEEHNYVDRRQHHSKNVQIVSIDFYFYSIN